MVVKYKNGYFEKGRWYEGMPYVQALDPVSDVITSTRSSMPVRCDIPVNNDAFQFMMTIAIIIMSLIFVALYVSWLM